MDELLKAARNYLDITWEDAATDEKLSGVLSRGKAYLDRIAGETLCYQEGSVERGLLFDYARYVLSGAFQDFSNDFSSELNAMNIECEVRRYAEELSDV